MRRAVSIALLVMMATMAGSRLTLSAAPLPSLFRGMAVADSPVGVRIVSVEPTSQAYAADLRPEDVIVQINGAALHSIDEFAIFSESLKGRAMSATVLILRNGQPREVVLHLYSYPVQQHWGVSFMPDHDFRFIDEKAGLAYWSNLARGFETAGQTEHALNAWLNALHNAPTDVDTALRAAELLWRLAQERLARHEMQPALDLLQQGTTILQRLFDQPLTDEQLAHIKAQLEKTVAMLREALQKSP